MATQSVNIARFAQNVEWDFFCDFQTLCRKSGRICLYLWHTVELSRSIEFRHCFLPRTRICLYHLPHFQQFEVDLKRGAKRKGIRGLKTQKFFREFSLHCCAAAVGDMATWNSCHALSKSNSQKKKDWYFLYGQYNPKCKGNKVALEVTDCFHLLLQRQLFSLYFGRALRDDVRCLYMVYIFEYISWYFKCR